MNAALHVSRPFEWVIKQLVSRSNTGPGAETRWGRPEAVQRDVSRNRGGPLWLMYVGSRSPRQAEVQRVAPRDRLGPGVAPTCTQTQIWPVLAQPDGDGGGPGGLRESGPTNHKCLSGQTRQCRPACFIARARLFARRGVGDQSPSHFTARLQSTRPGRARCV